MADTEASAPTTTKPAEEEEPTTKDAGEGEAGDDETTAFESTAVFQPVVQLQEVETKTHEEEEDALYKQRSKLYAYGEAMLDKGSGKKTWLERGVGEMKILKHRENGRIRVLMRQDKTMKVIANHVVDPRITIMPNVGSDKSWVWTAFDFSDGELKEEVFALKFGKSEDANEFKKHFEAAKEEMKAFLAATDEEPKTEGDAKAADDASDALSSLNIKAKEEGGAAQPATTD